jgi:hypothetical protein
MHEFLFIHKKTGNECHSGLILMQKMLNVCKPKTIVKVHHLEKKLNTILLWPTHKNNVCLLTTHMMTILQEIHTKTGKHSYTDQCLITNIFRALNSSPSENFLTFVDQLKSQWIMEEVTDPTQLIFKLDKMHCNMVADGSWLNTSKKDTKIVVLPSALQEVKKKFGDFAKKVSFDQDKPKTLPKKGGKKSGGSKRQTKTCCPEWQVTKKGQMMEHKGRKYIWCPHHAFKDGSVNGLYMPHPHKSGGMGKDKGQEDRCFKKCKEEERKKQAGNSPPKKPKQDKALKLALGSRLTTALVTQHHMSQTNAEAVFNSIYNEAVTEGLQES